MIISANQVERWTPFDLRDQDGAPLPGAIIYLIQPPTKMTKAKWRRDVAAAGASQHGRDELMATLKRGVRDLIAADQQQHWLSLIDEWDAAWRVHHELRQKPDSDSTAVTAAAEAVDAISDRMVDFERQMLANFPGYAQMLSDNQFWVRVAPLLAARHFLVGWENVELPFERVVGLVPEILLEKLSALRPNDWDNIGWIAMGLSAVTADDEKNSAGASASGANHEGSTPGKKARGPALEKS